MTSERSHNLRNQLTTMNYRLLLSLFLLLVITIACIVVVVLASDGQDENANANAINVNNAQEDGLEIHETFKPDNCDRKARATDVLTLHYKGSLEGSNQVFDSSYERNEPFTFQLGIGHVILGWERGLLGSCVGEKRRLVVPPKLGYGDAKHDQIPPKSTLVFEIEILKIEDGPKPVNVFKEIDADGDGRLNRKEVGEYLRKQLSHGQQHGDTATADDPNQMQMVDEIFMHEDKNRDDYITHEEFSGPKHDHDEL